MKLQLLSSALLATLPAVSAAPAEPTPIDPGSQGPATDGTYLQTVLDHHNVHRLNHSAKAVTWSKDLVKSAKILAFTCNFHHDTSINGGGYGQNIAAGTPPRYVSQVITNEFYNAEMPQFHYYGQANPDNYTTFGNWGHFTQLVWKNTAEVGCYTHDCGAAGIKGAGGDIWPYFTVCNYSPAGNIETLFGQNVGKPLGHGVVHAKWVPKAGSKFDKGHPVMAYQTSAEE